LFLLFPQFEVDNFSLKSGAMLARSLLKTNLRNKSMVGVVFIQREKLDQMQIVAAHE